MEQDALVQIIQMNYKLLIVQAYRILRHSQDAEDAVQNACLKAWRRSSMLRNSDCAVAEPAGSQMLYKFPHEREDIVVIGRCS